MNSFTRFIVFAIAFVGLTTAHAANPREELKQLTAQLQSNPSDTALREKIIKLAKTVKPAPTVPEEAQRRLGRGQAAFETATDASGFERAISEFQAASNAAPWLAAPYYNLGVAQEKAGKPREAMASFKLYLLASPNASDANAVKQRLYKLEYLADENSDDGLARWVEGTWISESGGITDEYQVTYLGNSRIKLYHLRTIYPGGQSRDGGFEITGTVSKGVVETSYLTGPYRLYNFGVECPRTSFPARVEIVKDQQTLILNYKWPNTSTTSRSCLDHQGSNTSRLTRRK